MYNITQNYKDKILKDSTQHELNIYIDNNKIEPNHIIDFKATLQLFNNNEFYLGCTPEKDIEFEIDKRDLPESYNEIRVESGLEDEIIPIGKFTIQSVEDDEFKARIKATDYMKKFEDAKYDGSDLIYPATMLQVLQDICTKVGVELGSTSFLNSNKQISVYDNTVSARTYLSYIAEQAEGFAVIGRDGKLYIKTFGQDIINLNINLFKDYKWGDKFKVSRVSYEDGVQNYKFGDETASTVYINQNNMYIVDSEQIENIYNQINNFEIYTFEGETIIDPAYDIGDILIIDGKKVLYQGELEYAGKFKANIKSKIQAKTEQESMQTKSSNSEKIRKVQSEINQIEGKITQLTEETTENTQKLTKAEQDINGVTTKVSSVEKSVENITNTEGEATGKSIHLEDSSDEPLVSIKVKGETNQATRSGKNLLKLNDTQTVNGVTATNNGNGTLTLNGTASKATTLYIANGTTQFVDGKTITAGTSLTQSLNVISGTSSDNVTIRTLVKIGNSTNYLLLEGEKTYTPAEDIILRPCQLSIKNGTIFNNWTIFPQLEIDGSATTPEQYGASPSLDCSSPIENVEGRNKFNINGELTDLSGGNFLTKIEGNKIIIPNIESNGSSALFDYIEVKENTDINISFNLLQGTARIGLRLYDKNKNIINNSTISLPKFTYNQYYQGYWHNGSNVSTTIPEGVKYIRYLTIGVQGTKKNIYEKFQIEKGNSKKPYAPYNSLEIKDVGENLLNVTAKTTTVQGLTFTVNEDKSITINGTNTGTGTAFFRLADNFVLPAGDYTLSNKNANASGNSFLFYDDNYNFVTKNISNATFTKDTTIKPYIRVNAGATVNNQTIYPMILKGTYTEETMPAYKPYQEQKETFPLGNQKLMKGSYLASGGIHHNRAQTTVNISNIVTLSNGNIGGIFQPTGKKYSGNNVLYCDKAKYDPNRRFITGTIYENPGNVVFVGNSTDTLETLKAKYDGAILEYELSEEEIVPYTEIQQEAWNKIEQLHTYKNVTNIFSDAELDIVYVRDNGLSDMYETKQNANKKYTETTQKLAEQKITTDSIQENVSKTETIVANNYKELKTKFDDYAPKSDVVTLQNSVEKIQTDTYTKTEINTKLIDGSVEKVSTTAGTFDENGLTIEKTNAKTKGNFNEKGMSVIDNTGSKGETLLFAGYDEELNETIVKSKNMTVEKYLVVGANSRFENYNNTTLNATGTGVFII